MHRSLYLVATAFLLAVTGCAGQSQQVANAEVASSPAPTGDAVDAAMNRAVGKALTDENLGLFFGLLRRSLSAAAEGKPAPELSADEKARLEATAKDLQKDALDASLKMIDQVEKEMRESIRKEGLAK